MLRKFARSFNTRKRVLFNVPGADERKLAKIKQVKADCIVLDLEDGVALSRKQIARELVVKTLPSVPNNAVRINSVGSGFEQQDLEVISQTNVQCIVIPKVEHSDHVEFIRSYFKNREVQLIACIESAIAFQRLDSIASSGIHGLVFASEDYCADTGITRTDSLQELLWARSAVVNAAKAYDLQAIDLVCLDYKNTERLKWECLNGKEMGFTGKQAIHPSQLDVIQDIFQPSEKEVEIAKRIVSKFNEFDKKGVGAFDLDGKVVDMPVVKLARKVLTLAGLTAEEIDSI